MCGILCISSSIQISSDKLELLLNSIHHRGPDYQCITSLQTKTNLYIYLLSTQLVIVGKEFFPIAFRFINDQSSNPANLVVGNIEIYNYKEIYNEYLRKEFMWNESYSDVHIILPLMNHFLAMNYSIEQSFKKLLSLIKGDFAFVVYLTKGNLLIARDSIGIRPLYFSFKDNLGFAVCSEIDTIMKIGFKYQDIHTVPVGSYSIINSNSGIYSINWNSIEDNIAFLCSQRFLPISSQQVLSNELIQTLTSKLLYAVKSRIPSSKFGLFLSGGIDSSLILAFLMMIKPKTDFVVISVGFQDSSDLKYSRDLCKCLNINLVEVIIDKMDVVNGLKIIIPKLCQRTFQIDVVDISIALPIYFASKKAKELNTKVVFSGQGADELFIGYNKYFNKEYLTNTSKLLEMINTDLINIASKNLERDDLISMSNSIEMRFPYLDIDLIKFILQLDLGLLYSFDQNKRKEFLRKVAENLDLKLPDFILNRRKKAAQYGSLVMKNLYQLAKPYDSLKAYFETFK